jgi:hypothetical protein
MISFNTGIPDFDSLIRVEGIGPATLRRFYENGDVLVYVGGNRQFRISGQTRWRYVRGT